MFVGPVFSIELITSARRERYYVWRVFYALLQLAVMVIIYIAAFGFAGADSIKGAADFAQWFFNFFAWLQVGAVLVLGPAMAGGSIAQERERRTIEYLFTTHLTNTEIVLSKVSAAVLQLMTSVLVGLPVFAMAMWLGGIQPSRLLAVYVITFSLIAAIVSLSVVASVLSRRALEAVAGTYIVLLILTFGPFLLDMLLRLASFYVWIEPIVDAMRKISPIELLGSVLNSASSGLGDDTWLSERWRIVWGTFFTHLAFSAACVAWAAWSLRRVHLNATVAAPKAERAGVWRFWRPELTTRPILWREMHARRSDSRLAFWWRVGLGIGVIVALGLMGWRFVEEMSAGRPDEFISFTLVLGTVIGCLALVIMAAWASNSIAAERENDTWTMLVSTPIEPGEVFFGKLLGSIYAARIFLLPLLILWFLAILADPLFVIAVVFIVVGFVAMAASSSALGLSLSLWCATSTRALGITMGIFFGVLVVTGCCYVLGFVNPIFLLSFIPWGFYAIVKEGPEQMWMYIFAFLAAVWGLGIALHLGTAALLWYLSVQNFDRLGGRAVIPLSGIIPTAPQTPFSASPGPASSPLATMPSPEASPP